MKIVTSNSTRANKKIQIYPNVIVQFNDKCIAELPEDADIELITARDGSIVPYVDVTESENDEQGNDDSQGITVETLSGMSLREIKELCSCIEELKNKEEEWKKMGKENLINYILELV